MTASLRTIPRTWAIDHRLSSFARESAQPRRVWARRMGRDEPAGQEARGRSISPHRKRANLEDRGFVIERGIRKSAPVGLEPRQGCAGVAFAERRPDRSERVDL